MRSRLTSHAFLIVLVNLVKRIIDFIIRLKDTFSSRRIFMAFNGLHIKMYTISVVETSKDSSEDDMGPKFWQTKPNVKSIRKWRILYFLESIY